MKESQSAKTICLDKFGRFPNTRRYLVMQRDEKKDKKITDWYLDIWPPNHMFYHVNAQEPGEPKAAHTRFIVEIKF